MPGHGGPPQDDGSSQRAARWAAARQGAREAFGVPAIVLGASFLGFGALVREAGLSPWHGLLSTALGWALPGQVAPAA